MKSVDYKKLNILIDNANKITKIVLVAITIIGLYALLHLLSLLGIIPFLINILEVLIPLFIGLFIAWILNPFVSKLEKKGTPRKLAIFISFIVFIAVFLIIGFIALPLFFEQVTEFINKLPSLINELDTQFKLFIRTFDNIEGLNSGAIYQSVSNYLSNIGVGLTENLPTLLITILENFFQTLMKVLLGLIIGYFLLSTKGKKFDIYLPNKFRNDILDLMNHVNDKMRNYILGVGIIASIIFATCTFSFWVIGLPAPLLFGFFCGITNVIPYVGPWIGGIPAVIIAFTVSPLVGIFALIVIIIIQSLESMFLQPLVMSKAMELHPVTILMGLLVFEHLFGIFGMIIAAPTIAIFKVFFQYFNQKYGWSETLIET